MSRAFVKEADSIEELPDRLVSEHRNLVTAGGLAMIEERVARSQADSTRHTRPMIAKRSGGRSATSGTGRSA